MHDIGGVVGDREPSLHQRIRPDIEGRIISGEWSPGFRIPFEVDLARTYNCSRMTVNKVLAQLAERGMIERRKRSGSFVRAPTSQSAVLEIRDIASEVAVLGAEYAYRLLKRQRRKAFTADRVRLGLPPGRNVRHCRHRPGRDAFRPVAGHRAPQARPRGL